MRWAFFLVLAAFAWGARLVGAVAIDDPAGSALLALGCLIIGGALCGELAGRLRLPKITGYLVLGMAVGPHALGIETARDAQLLRLFEELTLGLIALTAGGEFRLEIIRRRLKPLVAVTAAHTIGISLLVAGALLVLTRFVPFLGPVTPAETLAGVGLLAVIAVAVSPATTIAVMTDLRARGEMVETVLGVTIFKDLVIILLFTAMSALASSWISGGALELGAMWHVGSEIGLSLMIGGGLGALLGLYLIKVGRLAPLTVLLLALASAELGRGSWIEHLLVCMAAGFTVRVLFPEIAGHFINALEQSSTPIYVIFFALVGAGLNVEIFASVWLPALIYVAVRMLAIRVTTRLPAAVAGSGEGMVRYGWMGFIAQAGLSLGLAARVQRELADIGTVVATLVVAAVVINQLVGPIAWQRAIVAARESETERAARGGGPVLRKS
jgi:Kef-type K+ transport system membrane component KefB